MPDHTIAEKEKNRQTRLQRDLAASGEADPGTGTAATSTTNDAAPAATPAKKPAEQRGTGTDNTAANTATRLKALLSKLAAARKAGNTAFAARMEAQIAAIRKSTTEAK